MKTTRKMFAFAAALMLSMAAGTFEARAQADILIQAGADLIDFTLDALGLENTAVGKLLGKLAGDNGEVDVLKQIRDDQLNQTTIQNAQNAWRQDLERLKDDALKKNFNLVEQGSGVFNLINNIEGLADSVTGIAESMDSYLDYIHEYGSYGDYNIASRLQSAFSTEADGLIENYKKLLAGVKGFTSHSSSMESLRTVSDYVSQLNGNIQDMAEQMELAMLTLCERIDRNADVEANANFRSLVIY